MRLNLDHLLMAAAMKQTSAITRKIKIKVSMSLTYPDRQTLKQWGMAQLEAQPSPTR